MERIDDMDKDTRYPSYYMFQPGYDPGPQVQTQSRSTTLFGQSGIFPSSGPNLNATLPPPDACRGNFPSTLQSESPSFQWHLHGQGSRSHGGPVKKRGRPRKYGANEMTALGFSPGSSVPILGSGGGSESLSQHEFSISMPKRGRGRPRGSGSWQKLASIGGLMLSSAVSGFKPHVLKVSTGEDIAAKLMAFSRKGSRTVCILSASGVVSMVSINLSPAKCVTYQGHFEILSLSGTYVSGHDVHAEGLGSLSICLSDSECQVFGGPIFGRLLAASPVQLMVASFSRNDGKAARKPGIGIQLDGGTVPADDGEGDQRMVCSSPTHVQETALTTTAQLRPGQVARRSNPRDIDLTLSS